MIVDIKLGVRSGNAGGIRGAVGFDFQGDTLDKFGGLFEVGNRLWKFP